jgi:hypothetical protein
MGAIPMEATLTTVIRMEATLMAVIRMEATLTTVIRMEATLMAVIRMEATLMEAITEVDRMEVEATFSEVLQQRHHTEKCPPTTTRSLRTHLAV